MATPDRPQSTGISKAELISNGPPEWFHTHGFKMQVEKYDSKNKKLTISTNSVSLEITRANPYKRNPNTVDLTYEFIKLPRGVAPCLIKWSIQTPNGNIDGRVRLTSSELRSAFGFDDPSSKTLEKNFLCWRFGADSGEQGKYIRRGKYLNIPCPGTALDGDPNISIYLSTDIKDAVRIFTEEVELPYR